MTTPRVMSPVQQCKGEGEFVERARTKTITVALVSATTSQQQQEGDEPTTTIRNTSEMDKALENFWATKKII